jgi:hypothetical protein
MDKQTRERIILEHAKRLFSFKFERIVPEGTDTIQPFGLYGVTLVVTAGPKEVAELMEALGAHALARPGE